MKTFLIALVVVVGSVFAASAQADAPANKQEKEEAKVCSVAHINSALRILLESNKDFTGKTDKADEERLLSRLRLPEEASFEIQGEIQGDKYGSVPNGAYLSRLAGVFSVA